MCIATCTVTCIFTCVDICIDMRAARCVHGAARRFNVAARPLLGRRHPARALCDVGGDDRLAPYGTNTS